MKKVALLFFVAVFASSSVLSLYSAPTASAVTGNCFFAGGAGGQVGSGGSCSEAGLGACGANDVFTGRDGNCNGYAVPASSWGNKKQGLIDFITSRYGGSKQNKIGAAFIMREMLGGGNAWVDNSDKNDWEAAMNNSKVTVGVYWDSSVGRTSWYDNDKQNNFYGDHAPTGRTVVRVFVSGQLAAEIETTCGNLVAHSYVTLPKKWGAMTGSTTVDKPVVAPGERVTWTHQVWNTGSISNERTDTITGGAFWDMDGSNGTTGPGTGPFRGGNDRVLDPEKDFSRGFDKGKSNGWTANYKFTIPDNAKDNQRYCQFVQGSPTSSSDGSSFKSTTVCTKVVADRPTGTINIQCVDGTTGERKITYKFSDKDSTRSDPVVAKIVWGSNTYNVSNSSGQKTVTGNKTVTDKNGGVLYKLNVKDVGSPGEPYTTVDQVRSEACERVTSFIDPPTYSYFPSLTGYGTVQDSVQVDIQPKSGNDFPRQPRWDIYEVTFNRKPTAAMLGNNSNDDGCSYISSQMGAYGTRSCDLRFSGKYKTSPDEARANLATNSSTPDPIGTWRCYITRLDTTPWISDALNERWPEDEYGFVTRTIDGEKVTTYEKIVDWPDRPADPGRSYRYSPFSCSLSGLDPKVQVQSHDARIGGDSITSLRAITGGSGAGSKFGSWGEYGVQADGEVINTASGSGLSKGKPTPQVAWSNLTFANIPSGTYGSFNQGVDLGGASNYIGNANPVELTNGVVNSSVIDTRPGQKNVYYYDGDVTINGDIRFGNSYSSIYDIPRVVIVANSITIDPGVRQIDPWLIAVGSDTGQGYVNTCSAAAQPPRSFSGLNLTYKGACANQLVFNGAVYAKKLYLYRTAGSGVAEDGGENPADVNLLDRPAEIFNLRPDNFLSAYSGGSLSRPVASTDSVSEIAPRF